MPKLFVSPRGAGKTTRYSNDYLLHVVKNRHAIIRGVYLKIRQLEPLRKVDDVVGELQEKSGYSRRTILIILRNK